MRMRSRSLAKRGPCHSWYLRVQSRGCRRQCERSSGHRLAMRRMRRGTGQGRRRCQCQCCRQWLRPACCVCERAGQHLRLEVQRAGPAGRRQLPPGAVPLGARRGGQQSQGRRLPKPLMRCWRPLALALARQSKRRTEGQLWLCPRGWMRRLLSQRTRLMQRGAGRRSQRHSLHLCLESGR